MPYHCTIDSPSSLCQMEGLSLDPAFQALCRAAPRAESEGLQETLEALREELGPGQACQDTLQAAGLCMTWTALW